MSGFIIRGNADELSAQLKATLEARDARFNASLEALFKPAPPHPQAAPPPQPAPAAKAPSAGGPQESTGLSLSRKSDCVVRGSRLR